MSLDFVGTTFPPSSQWHEDEIALIEDVKKQIKGIFFYGNNLLINTTWFGPQFDNGEYTKFLDLCSKKRYDNVFLLASVDPVFLADHEIEKVRQLSGDSRLHLLGNFDSAYNFNFFSMVLPKYFKKYNIEDIKMKSAKYPFINYNRKPREHRHSLVKKLISRGVDKKGIVTLGKDDGDHKFLSDPSDISITLNETIEEIGEQNQWWPDSHGIPHDIHSLGRLEIWQNHFLNIVGESEYDNACHTFVSEKTWKPIIGLRPFIINGQTKIYKWLRARGFRTFNQHWNHIPVEAADNVQDNCAAVAEFISNKDEKELKEIYNKMLPDLLHNRDLFYKFSISETKKKHNFF